MKTIYIILSALVLIGLLLTGAQCTADSQDRMATNEQQRVYQIGQPIPFYPYSHERAMVVQIYNARNGAINTWSVWRSEGTGAVEDWCPSVGYGIPYDTSLTNPMKYEGIEQAEPNGLFASKNTKATWVLCRLPNGSVSPVYIESTVTTYSWPIKVEDGEVVHLYDQAPSVILDTSEPKPKESEGQ